MELGNVAFQPTQLSEYVLLRLWRGAFAISDPNVHGRGAGGSDRSVLTALSVRTAVRRRPTVHK
eukprot:7167810-Prymnesium_polylepis.1